MSADADRVGQEKGVTNVCQLRVVTMVIVHCQGSVIATKDGEVSFVTNQIVEMDVILIMDIAVFQVQR